VKPLVAIALLLAGGCRAPEEKPQIRVVRMATILGRVMSPLSAALAKALPEQFAVQFEVQRINNSGDYPRLIDAGDVELAMIQTDLAYVAYTQGLGPQPQPMRKLRGVAVLYTTPLHVLATASSDVRSVADLRGRRVFVGAEGSPTEFTAKMSLEALGISLDQLQLRRMADSELVESLKTGALDAVFYRGNDPYPAIQEMMHVPGVSFIPMQRAQIEAIRAHHPFLRSTSIPAGMYGDHAEIETVGGEMLLACRADLPEELVYWVTRTLFETLPELGNSLPALRRIDPEHIQSSPIPLHRGAARFYRERELFP
jgi:TRAP transporter TAXI family solute receptor